MRFPFVSRARYDLLDHNSRELIGMYKGESMDLRAQLEIERARYDTLLDHVLHPPQPVKPATAATTAAVAREKDPVTEKIRQEAGGDPRLLAHFTNVAVQYKRDHPSATRDEIAAQIGWTTADPPQETVAA